MKEINFGELVFLFPVYIWDDVLKKLVIELSFGCPVERVRLRRDKYVFFHSIFFGINIMMIYISTIQTQEEFQILNFVTQYIKHSSKQFFCNKYNHKNTNNMT